MQTHFNTYILRSYDLDFPIPLVPTPSDIFQSPVAHACNPSYLGGRDQEDHSLKPAWANSSQDPVSKIPTSKKGRQSD
jgi:hypothetical protein